MWITVEDCARWLDTSVDMVRILGMRGRFGISVDAQGVITHVAVPQPEPPAPDDSPEERGRLSLVPEGDGALSLWVASEPTDR